MTPSDTPAGDALVTQLLGSLIADFRFWFHRGLLLLACCPDEVMARDQRLALASELEQAQRQLQAASSLREAVSFPVALDLEALAPWHRLMLKVWELAAALRQAGVALPEQEWPAAP